VSILQIDAFQRGDMDALRAAVDASIPELWRLTRIGFLTDDDGQEAYVRGVESLDVAERLVARALARCYTPARRKAIDSEATLRRCELDEARAVLIEHAIRSGSMSTPRDDSDRAIAATEAGEPSVSIGLVQHQESMNGVITGMLAKMDDRTRRLVELRFAGGKSAKEIAAELGCGASAVAAHERRVRHQIRHALHVAFPEEKIGAATIDALLSNQALAPLPPPVTRERIQKEVLKRTHQDDPRPFGQRLAWALGALAIAGGLWTLMFLDVLPYYGDDLAPEPRVEVTCNPTCKIRVLAPKGAKRVAFGLLRSGKPSEPLLSSPTGRSIRLPLGASVKTVEIPYTAELPRSLVPGERPFVVAIFSEDRLNRDQILALTDGRTSISGVFTTSAAIALE
jgi:DNA-directed RNA polymerase specialized sigma24 family protein